MNQDTTTQFNLPDEGDYDLIADFLSKNEEFNTKVLQYKTLLHWMADFWRGKYSRLFVKNNEQGIAGITDLWWSSKALKANKNEEVRVKVKYYIIPFDNEIAIQYLTDVIEKDLGCKVEGNIIDGKQKLHTGENQQTGNSNSNVDSEPARFQTRTVRAKRTKHSKRKTSSSEPASNGKSATSSNELPALCTAG